MLNAKDRPSENNCSDCVRILKEIAELKKAFIEAEVESVRQCTQLKDEISESNEDCSYTYGQLQDAKAEIKQLKAEHSSGSQNKKMVLEEVGQPESYTKLRAPHSLTSVVKENDY
jgi:1,2-phenylacetyl-CoA epoxidase catalytic subunit